MQRLGHALCTFLPVEGNVLAIPLQIVWRDVPKTDALEDQIQSRAEKLEEYCDSIMGCRVTVERSQARHRKGNLYRLRIDIRVPDKEILVTRDPAEHHAHEDMYVSIRDAFDAAKRQLQDYVRVRRGQVKPHDVAHTARVARLFPEEDYGFLETVNGDEIYFHRNALVNVDFDRLEVGTEVSYVEEYLDEGPQAKQITVGKHHPAT